jgi:hypothetical protein
VIRRNETLCIIGSYFAWLRVSGTGYFDIPQLSGLIDYLRPRDPGYDEIRAPDIVTFCMGQAASMAAVLLAARTQGKRFSLPIPVMIHQPSMGGWRARRRTLTFTPRKSCACATR